ncbi:MAG: hypothetical protein P4L10_05760 [Acidobacteriaceae bacterium]|nr:hypothetical protein [Acidobacteriaceae bacterium]
MRRHLILFSVLISILGCVAARPAAAPTLPPNTIPLSQMMRELSAQPGFTDAMLAELSHASRAGALLTPALLDTMRKLILGRDWQGLDAFPGWTIHTINGTVAVGSHLVARNDHPTPQQLAAYIDLGPYALDKSATEDLDKPSNRPALDTQSLTTNLAYGVTRGDGPDPRLAPLHSESARLAEVLNRLSINTLDGAQPFTAVIAHRSATTVDQLIANLIAAGDNVTIADARYFANFGHFHSNGRDVMMPFMINTQVFVPAAHFWQRRHDLLEPVAHAEYEFSITNPHDPTRNADVTYYFGIDGNAEFRTNDQLNQPWVMGRHAHEYRGPDAVEVARLTGLAVLLYAHEHLDHPDLPFGGYYALGVCQDTIAAIERKMTGTTTLFPITRDMSLFTDPRDAEMNALLAQIPDDRDGTQPPSPERIFGSLPTTDLAAITVPGLADDFQRTYAVWQQGKLARNNAQRDTALFLAAILIALLFSRFALRRRATARR